ncbi:MAG: hypothetical protein MI924_08155 [Chloroflexales bacterium]|nr:hypothetical protein [Chloroflexales bacterium]
MEKQEQQAFCSCHQGLSPKLPVQGQQVRVTLLKDIVVWEGDQRVVTPAGTSYEGNVTQIDPEGFFDLTDESGFCKGFYAFDTTIKIEAPVAQEV